MMKRGCGVLLPVTSLPSPYGIGTMGEAAYTFVDDLYEAGQSYWQILPIGPTGFGDSPYQSFSTFAGNPYWIDLDLLARDGLLKMEDYVGLIWAGDDETVDYGRLYDLRFEVLKKAYFNFKGTDRFQQEYEAFLADSATWLNDYALFMALKGAFGGRSWQEFPVALKQRDCEALTAYGTKYAEDVDFWRFIQFFFFRQWFALKAYANEHGIKIIGDLPIYVAMDSADVWTHPEQFELDAALAPVHVAGCPPDAFSATGQLWGNPVYDWDHMKKDHYHWWMERLGHALKVCDIIRIDHFRGFDSYYSIDAGAETAMDGTWEQGPGMALFDTLEQVHPGAPIIAEDLGYLTPSVKQLLADSGFPGMKVLQFGFDDRVNKDYLPHNFIPNCIVYTGTHDNTTLLGWLAGASDESRDFVLDYYHMKDFTDFTDTIIAHAMESVADTVIVPLQDYLGLGDEARINFPSTTGNNWQWRMKKDAMTTDLKARMRKLSQLYERLQIKEP